MSLIPASVIADLTANVDEAAMNESWTITTVTMVSDGAGGSTTTTATATTIGYLWTASGDEAGEDQIRALGRHRIAIPKTVAVDATATITQQSTGKVFNIVYPFPVTAYSTSRILGLEDA
jgi:hypothetical protein